MTIRDLGRFARRDRLQDIQVAAVDRPLMADAEKPPPWSATRWLAALTMIAWVMLEVAELAFSRTAWVGDLNRMAMAGATDGAAWLSPALWWLIPLTAVGAGAAPFVLRAVGAWRNEAAPRRPARPTGPVRLLVLPGGRSAEPRARAFPVQMDSFEPDQKARSSRR